MGFILSLIITGLVVGALGRLAIPGRNPMSIPVTILVGIGGALVGGLIGRLLFGDDGPHLIFAVAAAALIVYLMQRNGDRSGIRR
ncbi:MAG TPA: hypothetical protein VM938_10280 [Acidimicrobiales bacterium]|nr:hypothetical protein [Acidimicrobiales bacterium]